MTLRCSKRTCQIFCRVSINLSLMFSQDWAELISFWKEDHRRDVPLQHFRDRTSTCFSAGDVNLDHPNKVVSVASRKCY